ncbi:hypothetical protein ATY78_07900 [Rhizobium sp. R635]|uniref:hypothetical protein n=1 Tax=Rhizobium sp. R635 TaxID=1764275 RepID=UPI000B537406|nr:hypothetical protein [Rhizobium sp. R635]OWV80596.1 hypothetical protein ATY78_07900 [Rhizobium sp. R635]
MVFGWRLLGLALIVAVLSLPAWIAWQWHAEHQIYADPEDPALTITPQHIEALRKLQFAWSTSIESGGPVVNPLAPYGSDDLAADLGPIIGTSDRIVIARFHREVSTLLTWALANCGLADGQYHLDHLDNATMQRRLRNDLAGLPGARINSYLAEMPRLEPDGYFQFTRQHLQLLHHLSFEWPDSRIISTVAGEGYPAPVVNFKRPFGDMSAFEIDMAAILGQPRPVLDHVDPALNRYYWEMWPALQAFVQNVRLDAAKSTCVD